MTQSKKSIKFGDIIRLGNHVLACGDCRDQKFIARVVGNQKIKSVIVDPPYGVAIVESKRNFKTLLKDKLDRGDHTTSGKEKQFLHLQLRQNGIRPKARNVRGEAEIRTAPCVGENKLSRWSPGLRATTRTHSIWVGRSA